VNEAAQLRKYLADRDVACPMCGYNLRGAAGSVCTECGYELSEETVRSQTQAARRQMIALVSYQKMFMPIGIIFFVFAIPAIVWIGMFFTLLLSGGAFVLSSVVSIAATKRCSRWVAAGFGNRNRVMVVWVVGVALPLLILIAGAWGIETLSRHTTLLSLER